MADASGEGRRDEGGKVGNHVMAVYRWQRKRWGDREAGMWGDREPCGSGA